jgi:peroxiredoxin
MIRVASVLLSAKSASSHRLLLAFLLGFIPLLSAQQPQVGAKAPDFTLATPENKSVHLADMLAKGPVALVVLRGYPGYQCPYCNRQLQDLIEKSPDFAALGVQIVAVYPGPPKDLGNKANEFLTGKKLPPNFTLVLDPGYEFTNLYGLRWDADHETALPSTFLLNQQGIVFFSKVVKEHGGRASSAEMLDALPKQKPKQ